MTLRDLARQVHIDQLCKEEGCIATQKPSLPGMMFVEHGYIEGPTISTQVEYLTMLHELGHVNNKHTQGRPPHTNKVWYFQNGVLRSEAEAWNYALDKCVEPIEDESRRFMWDFCLGSYYRHALESKGQHVRLYNGERYHHEFIYDPPDDYFRNTVMRIQGSLENFQTQYKF